MGGGGGCGDAGCTDQEIAFLVERASLRMEAIIAVEKKRYMQTVA